MPLVRTRMYHRVSVVSAVGGLQSLERRGFFRVVVLFMRDQVLIRDWGVACEVRLGLFYMSEIQKVKQYIAIGEKGEGRCA